MTYPTYTRAEDAAGVSSIALPVFDRLPSAHMLVEIDGNYHYPTLLKGDRAVVDTSDKELVEGELYAIQQSRGRTCGRSALRRRNGLPSANIPSDRARGCIR